MARQPQNSSSQADDGGITRVALVLDRSSSMRSIREGARSAFNECIDRVAEEAARGAGATLTLVTFNQEVKVHLENVPASKARKLEPEDYIPAGSTALFDAVAQAIVTLQEAGPLGPADAALVLVVTDGEENSSREITQKHLARSMNKLEKTGAWTFSFLCANVDIRDLSNRLGLDRSAMMSWNASESGVRHMGQDMLGGVDNYLSARRVGRRSIGSLWKDITKREKQKTEQAD